MFFFCFEIFLKLVEDYKNQLDLQQVGTVIPKCVVRENIHTLLMEGFFGSTHPPPPPPPPPPQNKKDDVVLIKKKRY